LTGDTFTFSKTEQRLQPLVGNTGAARYTIPIVVPPGTGGLAPSLSLVYDSQSGWGNAGYGWNLAGLGSIGRWTGAGVPTYDDAKDSFTLDGEVLVYDGSRYWYTWRDNLARIEHKKSGTSDYWLVTFPDGTEYRYGYNANSRIEAVRDADGNGTNDNVIRRWALDRVKDANGNYYTITYSEDTTDGDFYPTTIVYTFNDAESLSWYRTVKLFWETRPDVSLRYDEGAKVLQNERLDKIEVWVRTTSSGSGGSLLRRYELTYTSSSTSGRSLLSTVQEFGTDGTTSLPAHRFTYYEGPGSFGRVEDWDAGGDVSKALKDGTSTAVQADLIDMDGDGHLDRVRWIGQNYDLRVHRNTGTRFESAEYWHQPGNFSGLRVGDGQGTVWRDLVDVTGDGLVDIIYGDGNGISYYENNGRGFWDAGTLTSQIGYPVVGSTRNDVTTITGLLDRMWSDPTERLAAYATTRPQPNLWEIDWKREGYSFGHTLGAGIVETGPCGSGIRCTFSKLMDLTGDGIPEFVVREYRDSGNLLVYRPDPYYGFNSSPEDWGSPGTGAIERRVVSSQIGEIIIEGFADVNGDGLPDHVAPSSGATGGIVTWNTGLRLAGSDTLEGLAQPEEEADYLMISGLIDMDGDGLLDSVAQASLRDRYEVRINNGKGFGSLSFWATTDGGDLGRIGSREVGLRDRDPSNPLAVRKLLVDITGDGLPDDVTKDRNQNFKVRRNLGADAGDRLKTITYPTGGSQTFSYEGKVVPHRAAPVIVVKEVKVSDGLGRTTTTKYAYSDPYYVEELRSFSGFRWVTETDDDNHQTKYEYEGGHAQGLVTKVERFRSSDGSDGKELQAVDYTYAMSLKVNDYRHQAIGLALSSWRVLLAGVTITDYDPKSGLSLSRKRTYTYDDYGNITEAKDEGYVDLSGDEARQTTEYATNTTAWIVNRPKHVTLAKTDGSGGWTTVREQWIFYDDQAYGSLTKGNPTKVEAWLSTGGSTCSQASTKTCVVTTTRYDSYGNVIWTKDARANAGGTTNSQGHTTDITYDSDYRTLQVSVRNALDQITSTGYDAYLRPTTVTDPNGQPTTTSYDALSRVTKIVRPLDSDSYPTETRTYSFDGTAPEYVSISRRENHGGSGTLERMEFIDGLGRPISVWDERTVSGTTSNWNVTDTYYTDLGQVWKRSVPYSRSSAYSSGDPRDSSKKATVYAYDPLGRVTSEKAPDLTMTLFDYGIAQNSADPDFDGPGRLAKYTTDALGRKSRASYDAGGRILTVTEALGAGEQRTRYTYDPATGELLTIKTATGTTIRFSYDSLGRRTSEADPDRGTWRFDYDLNGNLTKQTDAKGQVTTFTYNALNQPTKTEAKDVSGMVKFQYTYTYGTNAGANEVGRLTYVTGYSDAGTTRSFERRFTYDARGRRLSEELHTDWDGSAYAKKWRTKYSYDALDRLKEITYPGGHNLETGEVVTITYNTRGLVKKIAGTDTYLSDSPTPSYDTFGRPLSLTFGNGTTTTFDYYDTSGESDPSAGSTTYSYRLRGLTVTSAGTKLVDLGYEYDKVGNLVELTDNLDAAKSQSFTYDQFNRLRQAIGVYNTRAYAYDAVGNLTCKDAADATNCAGGLAYSYVSGTNRVASAGSYKYSYDENGSVTALPMVIQEDDFSATTIDSTRWSVKQGSWTVSSGQLKASGTAEAWLDSTFSPSPSFQVGVVVTPQSSESGYWRAGLGLGPSGGAMNTFELFFHTAQDNSTSDGQWFVYRKVGGSWQIVAQGTRDDIGAGKPHRLQIKVSGSGSGTTAYFYVNGQQVHSVTLGASFPSDKFVRLAAWADDRSFDVRFDDFRYTRAATLTYDVLNRLSEVSGARSETYTYDDGTTRIKKVVGSTATYYVNRYYEEVWNGNTKTDTIKHYYLNDRRIALRDSQGLKYVHADHLGGTLKITDSGGAVQRSNVYDPFGVETDASSGTWSMRYAHQGKEVDKTRLSYYGARYYDPLLGRFLSADNVIVRPYDPQSLNRYAYVRNNPLRLVDPDGHAWQMLAGTIAWGVGLGINTVLERTDWLDWMSASDREILHYVADALEAGGTLLSGPVTGIISKGLRSRAIGEIATHILTGKSSIKPSILENALTKSSFGLVPAAVKADDLSDPATIVNVLLAGANASSSNLLGQALRGVKWYSRMHSWIDSSTASNKDFPGWVRAVAYTATQAMRTTQIFWWKQFDKGSLIFGQDGPPSLPTDPVTQRDGPPSRPTYPVTKPPSTRVPSIVDVPFYGPGGHMNVVYYAE